MPTRRPAPARSRSRRRTTSTISRSASAPGPAGGQHPRRRGECHPRRQSPTSSPSVADNDALRATIAALDGLDRFTARKRVVDVMEERGLVEKVEDHVHTVPHGDRSNVPIEPFLTDQWYVDAKTLAAPAIAAVRDGRTVFVPKNWEKTYFDWMENIQPWCISRQLWWGHQIPAWYGPDGKVFVATSEAEAQTPRPTPHYGKHDAAHARRGRPRHLVLLGAVAVLDARLAGRDARAQALLPDQRARHRLRHHLLLGRPHDDDGPPFHAGGAVPRRLHPRPRPRREGRQDVEVEGQRHRPARAHRRIRRRRAPLHAGRDGGAGPRHQALDRRASKATATSRPSSGTPRASPSTMAARRSPASILRRRRRPSTAGSPPRRRGRRPRSPRRSRPTSSTRRPAPSTASSGTSPATGISS